MLLAVSIGAVLVLAHRTIFTRDNTLLTLIPFAPPSLQRSPLPIIDPAVNRYRRLLADIIDDSNTLLATYADIPEASAFASRYPPIKGESLVVAGDILPMDWALAVLPVKNDDIPDLEPVSDSDSDMETEDASPPELSDNDSSLPTITTDVFHQGAVIVYDHPGVSAFSTHHGCVACIFVHPSIVRFMIANASVSLMSVMGAFSVISPGYLSFHSVTSALLGDVQSSIRTT
ncbi:hypothetical protein C8J56DRAFT_1058632 [Mycena floridula]|nr:hypothetical protein C8J56DRAFT_1058632 [Mycena floridula]